MKVTKKQWMIGGAVALVLAGGGAGVIANNQAQAQAEKTAQEAKTAHDNLIKEAKKATEKAETFKAEADVKTAQEAIKKLDEKDKTSLISRVETVRQNWDFVNKADKAVTNAEKVQNDTNVKTAQSAIDKIKAEMAKSKKTALQKRLDKVKTSVENTKKQAQLLKQKGLKQKEEAEQRKAQAAQANTQNETQTQGADVNNAAPQAEAPVSGGNVDYGQYAQAPAQNAPSYNAAPQAPATPNYGGGSTSGGQAVAPTTPPAHTGGGNANSNIDLGEANNQDHASNGENPADGGR